MPALAAFLRGINVGPHKRMKMDALRKLFADLGFEEATTYLQSGNVVFQSAEPSSPKLVRQIEEGIEQAFGFRSEVILRTAEQMREVVDANPFAGRDGIEPSKLLVLFFATPISAEEKRAVQQFYADPEEIAVRDSELYIYYPSGIGRSKLDGKLGKALKTSATGRNWNSVVNVLALMSKTA